MNNQAELIASAQSGDTDSYEKLIEQNTPLVWSIVRRFASRGIDSDDLFQLGCMGLLKAIQGFDANLGNQFSTYAVPKIAGEIRRFLRDDGPIKVSRSLKERAYHLNRLRESLCQKHGREPTLSELSEQSGWSLEEIAEIDCACSPTDSLSRDASEDGPDLESTLGDQGIEDTVLDRVTITDAIKSLSTREQIVISARFFRGLTQDKTSKLLGVSQVQVSRIERTAIKKLRELL